MFNIQRVWYKVDTSRCIESDVYKVSIFITRFYQNLGTKIGKDLERVYFQNPNDLNIFYTVVYTQT